MRFPAIQRLPARDNDKVVTPRPVPADRQLLRFPARVPPIVVWQYRTHSLIIRQTRPVARDLHGIRVEEVGVDVIRGDECRVVCVPYES